MGGSFAQDIFGGLMGHGLTKADMQQYAQQLSQDAALRRAELLNNAMMNQSGVRQHDPTVISTGPGLLPKDLIPDLETAADIPARIARMVETMIESRKAKPAQQQWPPGVSRTFITASSQQLNPFIRGF